MSEREKLLPCPFCGGEPLSTMVNAAPALWRISCKNCDARPSASFGEASAIKKWNKRAGGWQPIASAPKDGTLVLVSGPSFPAKHGPYISTGMYRDGMWFEREEMYPREWLNAPTHWQPLSAPPEDKP